MIGASLLIQMATFSGLVLLGFVNCFQKLSGTNSAQKHSFWHRLQNQVIPSFASGALLATTVFLLIPEGFELLEGVHADDLLTGHAESEEAHDEHRRRRFLQSNETVTNDHEEEIQSKNEAAWRLGASLLGGFLFPILLGAIFPPPDISECEVCLERVRATESNLSPAAQEEVLIDEGNSEVDVDGDASRNAPTENLPTTVDLNCEDGECTHCHDNIYETKAAEDVPANARHIRNFPLAASIIMGDFCHNFCDGIFLGTAFLLCSKSLAWTITATTIYHEIAQEIADFALLTHHCGLTIPEALVSNFVAGCSVMIGGLIVLAVNFSDRAVGSILCISAGVYVYIAASECIPRIQANRQQISDTLIFLVCFVLGAVPIGLVLLTHEHCEAGH